MKCLFRLVLGLAFMSAASAAPLVFQGTDGPGKGKHIVLIAADQEYRSEQSLPMLAKILSQRHGFDCTVLFAVNEKGEVDPTMPPATGPGRAGWRACARWCARYTAMASTLSWISSSTTPEMCSAIPLTVTGRRTRLQGSCISTRVGMGSPIW